MYLTGSHKGDVNTLTFSPNGEGAGGLTASGMICRQSKAERMQHKALAGSGAVGHSYNGRVESCGHSKAWLLACKAKTECLDKKPPLAELELRNHAFRGRGSWCYSDLLQSAHP